MNKKGMKVVSEATEALDGGDVFERLARYSTDVCDYESRTMDTHDAAKKDIIVQTLVFAFRDQIGNPAAHSIDTITPPSDP